MWKDLPHHRGWSLSQLVSAADNASPVMIREAVAFLQEWLVFSLLGTMSVIFGVKINTGDFLVEEHVSGSKETLVDLDKIQPFLFSLSRELNAQGETTSTYGERKLVEDTMKSVHEVHRQLKSSIYLLHDERLAIFSEIIASTLDLGLAALVESYFTDEIWNVHSHVVLKKMSESGWCPHHLAQIEDLLDTATTEALFKSLASSDHAKHARCTKTMCFDDNIDTSGYKTLHVNVSCVCKLQTMPEKLADILLGVDGAYPIISISRSQLEDKNFSGPFDIRVESSASRVPYSAISHVWSDGCGNQNANALPLCQIRRIALHALAASGYAQQHPLDPEIMRPISPDSDRVCLWMDTLCVPIRNELAKKKSIQRMYKTYQVASIVVVIDAHLASLSYKEDMPICNIARTICRWTRRLWTFNEGRLAQDLVFIFADGPKRFLFYDSTYHKHLTMSQNAQLARIAQTMVSSIPRMDAWLELLKQPVGRTDGSSFVDMVELWSIFSGIKFRSTSKADDEALCLAQIFKLDPTPIREASSAQKMALLLTTLKHLPRNLIFIRGEKLSLPGYNWAPATLRSIEIDDFRRLGFKSSKYVKALVSSVGLVASFPSIAFYFLQLQQKIIIWYEDIKTWCVYQDVSETGTNKISEVMGDLALLFAPNLPVANNDQTVLKEKTLSFLKTTKKGDVAILVKMLPAVAMSPNGVAEPEGKASEVDSTMFGRYICRVECIQDAVYADQMPDCINTLQSQAGFVPDQKWTIS